METTTTSKTERFFRFRFVPETSNRESLWRENGRGFNENLGSTLRSSLQKELFVARGRTKFIEKVILDQPDEKITIYRLYKEFPMWKPMTWKDLEICLAVIKGLDVKAELAKSQR